MSDSENEASEAQRSSLIPRGVLPSYLAVAFQDLYEEDGVAVFAKGLGWLNLMASFCRFYADANEGHLALIEEHQEEHKTTKTPQAVFSGKERKPPLVLVLGLKEEEQNGLMEILQSWGTPHKMMPAIINNETGQGKERAVTYSRGGVCCVTSRILIVDLLTKVLPSQDIDGMLVAHADKVTNESTEAFILRIFTSQKKRDKSFIKAFTDSPEGLLSGFSKVDKTLKALQVRSLFLYPRFHDYVKEELELHAPEVIEIHQPLSPLMQEIQAAVVAAVQTCMRELKKATPFVEWTGEDVSIENCVTSSFDRAVARQLDKDWHRLSPATKRLVEDLRTMRKLFQNLLQYDCVTFWFFINSLKTNSAAARHPSMWLLTPAADRLFRKAKERVYRIQPGKRTAKVPNPVSTLVPVLEENPKWRLLQSVINEIQEKDASIATTILVLVQKEGTAEDLRDYLRHGRDRTMSFKFLRYLEKYNGKPGTVINSNLSEESRLLLEEETKVRNIVRHNARVQRNQENTNDKESTKKRVLNAVPSHVRKRRRIALEQGRGEMTGGADDRERQAVLDDAVDQVEHDLNDVHDEVDSEEETKEDDPGESVLETMFRATLPTDTRVVIRTFDSFRQQGDPGLALADIDPSHVIMYDTDISLVRAVEVHAAVRGVEQEEAGSDTMEPQEPLKIYFLMFEASAEQKVFTKALEREQTAFVRLIHHKKTMPPPVLQVQGTQEMQQALEGGMVVNTYAGGSLPLAFDTRRGRGKAINAEKRDIAVDVREFRSALPSILHQGGMRLAPVTLTVGDFVLSNVHCIERKSISDLFGSFASGRLYTQAEAMSKYYKCPALLIEFDPDKNFCLQSSSDLGVDIRNDSTCSKMVLLTSHFPKLRILWSKSPHETLRLFKALKTNHDEVDVQKAMEVGRGDGEDILVEGDDDEINKEARDMLLRLPGVNVHNANKIMRECDSLADLVKLKRTDLRRIAGPLAGQKLWAFFNQRYGST